MGLATYRRKRDFKRTPEPRGARRPQAGRLRFAIQKHAARRLHYDFRLELDGVLKSWAVPKGPSLDPGEKRLAVLVEDHPIEYRDFEGTIPAGEYGGGTVMVWDRGTWIPEGDPARDLGAGRLSFRLEGEKLHGRWALMRMQGGGRGARGLEDGRENWLLIKQRDEAARTDGDILEKKPLSVITSRDLDEIARAPNRTWHSARAGRGGRAPARHARGVRPSKAQGTPERARAQAHRRAAAALGPAPPVPASTRKARGGADRPDPSRIAGAHRAALPQRIEPELATLVSAAPDGDEWLHEVKFDGYRLLARLDAGKARLFTRKGLDWTSRFPSIASALGALPVRRALLDGEIIATAPDGTSRFELLQHALSSGSDQGLEYAVFDLIHLDGWDLTAARLEDRKQALGALLAGAPARLRFSDHVIGRGTAFKREACRLRLEGVVSKRRDSLYRPGRGRDWLKSKCLERQEFVIVGYTDPSAGGIGFGALRLGYYEDGALRDAGSVGTGFTREQRRELEQRLRGLRVQEPPIDAPSRGRGLRGIHWLKPALVAEVEFTEWTRDGKLRHPSFLGLREDRKAREVVRERPLPAAELETTSTRGKSRPSPSTARAKNATRKERGPSAPAPSRARAGAAAHAGPADPGLTHPDRVLWPDVGVTKQELARHYTRVADRMLPHVAGRPLMLLRCPRGVESGCFHQKHDAVGMPAVLRRVPVREQGGTGRYLAIEDLEGLLALVQLNVLEIHVWGARAPRLEQPDRIVFDLDPDPALPLARVIEGARELRRRLGALELESFVMSTGGQGLHLHVPIEPRARWEEVRTFCRAMARSMALDRPERYTDVATKARRAGKIYVDYLRNARGATAIAPYSTRARPGARFAAPLRWEDLGPRFDPARFTLHRPGRGALPERDPWAGFERVRQTLSAELARAAARAR